MNLNLGYAPLFSGFLIAIAAFMLLDGFRKGLLGQLISFLSFIATMFFAWPLAGKLAVDCQIPFQGWLNTLWSGFSMTFAKQVVWFRLVIFGIQILAAILALIVRTVRRVKVLSFGDRLLGLGIAGLQVLGIFLLLSAVLQLPIFANGKEFSRLTVVGWADSITSPYVQKVLETYKPTDVLNALGVTSNPAFQKLQELTGIDEDAVNKLLSADLSALPDLPNMDEQDLQTIENMTGVAAEKLEKLRNLTQEQVESIIESTGLSLDDLKSLDPSALHKLIDSAGQ